MTFPVANVLVAFGSIPSPGPAQLAYLDNNFLNIVTGLNGLGNGSSVMTSPAITQAGILTANVTTLNGANIGALLDGQLLVGSNATGGFVTNRIAAGSGISVTNTPGLVTITATGAGGNGTVVGNTTFINTTGGLTGGGALTGNLTLQIASPLAANLGGTGQVTYTDGQINIGSNTTNGLVKTTLTAGSGISITNAPGAVTIATTGGGAAGQFHAQTFAANNATFTFTANATTTHKITLVGAGGGGGSGTTPGGGGGGGGAGGTAYYWSSIVNGSNVSIFVAPGGAAAGSGGNTVVTVGATIVVANGGGGGQATPAGANPGNAGIGGICINGTFNITGGDGSPGQIQGNTDGGGGSGGASSMGGGGFGAGAGTVGGDAHAYGAGGGGGHVSGAGGRGASGAVIIEWVS